jgi:hypothetical protein
MGCAHIDFGNGLFHCAGKLDDPAAADNNVAVVKHCSLSRSDGSLWLVESDQDFIIIGLFNQCRSGLVAMADLHRDPHGLD